MPRIAVFSIALLLTIPVSAFEPSGNIWEDPLATFRVGIDGESPTGGSWSAAFNRAMDSWSTTTGFQFVAIDEFLDPCIEPEDGKFGDGITGVDFSDTQCGTE